MLRYVCLIKAQEVAAVIEEQLVVVNCLLSSEWPEVHLTKTKFGSRRVVTMINHGLSRRTHYGQDVGMPYRFGVSRAKTGTGWKQTAPASVTIFSVPLDRRIS